MKLKKILLIIFAAVSCMCLGLALGCQNDPNSNDKFTVNFAVSEHVKYVIEGATVEEYQLSVDKDKMVNFSVEVEEGWLPETVSVLANGAKLAAVDGVYSYRVTCDATISATVDEDLLEGSGTKDSPFLVSSVKDLHTVAKMVNAGNPNYVLGYYKLQNDIDCGGAALDVIGHYDTSYSFFAGVFDGDGKTISNYKIETSGKAYVGFFGCVQVSTTRNVAMILNLNLKDFTIEATAADDGNVFVGAIAGMSAGANVVACSAVGGEILVYGSGYFSYAGGALGVQQSITVDQSDGLLYHFYGTTEYVHTDVAISAANGYIAAAGGIVGYSISSHERGASMILNSYAEGSVYGAMSSGGLVGRLGDYSSVANCYSTGFVNATVSFPDKVEDRDYFAYAGGIVGYAGVETVITDSFTTSETFTVAENVDMATGDLYAYASPKTAFAHDIIVWNCHSGNDVDATSANFVKNVLHWNEADWVIADGKYPSINYEQGENSFTVTFSYVGNTVQGNSAKSVAVEVNDDGYFTFGSYLDAQIPEFIVADKKGYTSYGFFFDEECKQQIPYGYVPTRDITVYVGFADYSKVAGTYVFEEKSGRTVKLILNTDATYQYVDVRSFDGTKYVYDGENIVFNDALFARLSGNVTVGDIDFTDGTVKQDVAQPWLNYQPYKFVGTVSDGKLLLYDGTYFTNDIIGDKDNRLVFVKPNAQSNQNVFIGTWERSASIKEKYAFTDSTWTYTWKNQTKTGSYSISDGVARMTGDITATATIDESGLLLIKESGKDDKYYKLENSFNGNWYSEETGSYLVLNGFGSDLAGNASAIIDGTVYNSLAYVNDGFFDGVTSKPYTYTLISGYALFGYFTYDAASRTITAMLYEESSADFIEFKFVLLDYYLGEWIGEENVGNDKPFTIIDFNGLGSYKVEGDTANLGYIVINGEEVEYECSIENGLNGSFTYNGVEYALTTDGEGVVTIKYGANNENVANFYRKDEMANTPLYRKSGRTETVYEFNGGGNLSKGGIMTVKVNGEKTDEYVYKIDKGTVAGRDIEISLYRDSVIGEKVGTITVNSPKFVLKLNGASDVKLDLYFTFGDEYWAVSGMSNSFYIGSFDLTPDERFEGEIYYRATGTFNGDQDVPFVYFPEYNYIYINYTSYADSESMSGQVVQIYLLVLSDGNIAVSSYPYLVNGDYAYAALRDELFGKWTNTVNGSIIDFNGLADSMYAYGLAIDMSSGANYYYTRGFGTVYMWVFDDRNVAYSIEMLYDDIDGEDIYKKTTGSNLNRMRIKKIDIVNSPIFSATDDDGTSYEFYMDGAVKVGNVNGDFATSSVDGNVTCGIITIDGKELSVEVNHDDHSVKVVKIVENN